MLTIKRANERQILLTAGRKLRISISVRHQKFHGFNIFILVTFLHIGSVILPELAMLCLHEKQ